MYCSKNETIDAFIYNLNGKWIEYIERKDTLSFSSSGDSFSMRLDRGKEIINGYLLPKYGSGYYRYKIEPEIILLNSAFSSNSNFKNYYFKITGDTLIIGNFYKSELGERLIFIK